MASTLFSGEGVVALNGSIGNRTYTFNAYGQYVKSKPPTPVGSAFLAAWQTTFASIVAVWETGMTDADRLPWYDFVLNRKNPLSRNKRLTGFQAFMSINANLAVDGLSPITVPPVLEPMARIISLEATGNYTLKTQVDFDVTLLYYTSNLLPPGRMSNVQLYYFLQAETTFSGIDTPDLQTTWEARFGTSAIGSGKKIFVKCVPLNKITGIRSVPQYVTMQF